MRGHSDSDIANKTTGETMEQYWKRRDLEYIKSWIEWGTTAVIVIGVLVCAVVVF